jgi:hypothetical protein
MITPTDAYERTAHGLPCRTQRELFGLRQCTVTAAHGVSDLVRDLAQPCPNAFLIQTVQLSDVLVGPVSMPTIFGCTEEPGDMLAPRDESQEIIFCLWRGQHARCQPCWLEKDSGVVDMLCELVSCQQRMDGVSKDAMLKRTTDLDSQSHYSAIAQQYQQREKHSSFIVANIRLTKT